MFDGEPKPKATTAGAHAATSAADAVAANRALWDEWTSIHVGSDFYDVDSFRRGGVRLRDFELEELGDVTRS